MGSRLRSGAKLCFDPVEGHVDSVIGDTIGHTDMTCARGTKGAARRNGYMRLIQKIMGKLHVSFVLGHYSGEDIVGTLWANVVEDMRHPVEALTYQVTTTAEHCISVILAGGPYRAQR